MKLPEKQRQRIITRHFHAIEDRGYDATALFWQNRQVQQCRFEVLWQLISQHRVFQSSLTHPLTILDVGCGFADLAEFLSSKCTHIEYIGIDLSPDMIFAAQCQHPKLRLLQGELFDFDWPNAHFDFVMCSGALNEVVDPAETAGRYARSVIERMVALARYGVSFNLLNRHHQWTASRPDLQSFYPQEMRAFCQSLVPNITLRDDYLENDFSLYLEVST